jgi:aryl-alcohol dehydrogenase-like predicted oxidoreductase
MIGYSILLQGAYTRRDRPVPSQYAGPEADMRLAALESVAKEVEATMNQVVIAWLRHSDPPVIPVIAGSQREQLLENIAALDISLTEDQIRRLESAGNPDVKQAWLR